MKVIQVMPEFALAGAEIMCENLVYGLQQQGVEVIIVSFYDYHSAITDRLEKNGIRIIYLNKKPGFDFSLYKKLYMLFKTEKPDIIHTHRYVTRYAIPSAICAKVKRKVHTIHTIAEKECGKAFRKLNKIFFKRANVIPVALSGVIQETIAQEYKIDKDKIPVIFNGVDLSKCKPKKNYTINKKIRILHIGRFCEVKNHKGLVQAFEIFHRKYPNSILQLIGDGELREEIQALVNEVGLSENVEFLGLQDKVYEYLCEADIFTLPSLYEGIPMTIIEAMATGLPIVATNVGGIPDMLVDGESALLTETDSKKIADAFLALANDECLREKLGTKGKTESVKFSSEVMARKYLRIYEGKHND